jgi:hypothetical protein
MKKEIQKELDSLAPKLSKLEKKNTFNVPDFYFESLAEKVIQKATEPNQAIDKEIQTNSGNSRLLFLMKSPYSLGIAASIILLLGVFQFFDFGNSSSFEASEQEILAYLDANLDEFDSKLFIEYELLDETDIAAIETGDYPINDQYFEEIIQDFDNATLEEIFY